MLYTPGIIGAAWFICCLFYAEIILKIIFDLSTHLSKLFNALLVNVVCIILCTVLGCVSYIISLPLGVSRILIGTSFLLLGKIVSSIGTRKMMVRPKLRMAVIGFLLFAGLLVLSKNNYSSYSSNTFSNIFISIISAIMGSTLVFIVANIIQNRNNFVKKTLLFLGKKTIGIVYFQFIGFAVVNYLIVQFYNLDISRVNDFPVNYEYNTIPWCCIYVVFGAFFSIFIYEIYSHILKHFLIRGNSYV